MITNPPVLIGRTFFYGGLQIRRDAWRVYAFGDHLGVFARRLSRSESARRLSRSESARRLSEASPLGVPPDLQSGVKRCPNLLILCGFAIRSKGVCINQDKKKSAFTA